MKTFVDSSVLLYFLGFIILFLQPTFLSGQKISDDKIEGWDVISVIDDAQIYSADESFNSQILKNKVRVKGNVTKVVAVDGTMKLIVTNEVKNKVFRNFASQLNEVRKKKEASVLKKFKKQLATYEKYKTQLLVEIIEVPNSSNQRFHSKHYSQSVVFASVNIQVFSNTQANQYIYIVRHPLGRLHSQKYLSYNNISLDYCFTTVFSVRPPPGLA